MKNNNLAQILNVFDYLRIILGLSSDYIMYYLSPPLGDNRDNAVVFFRPKKRDSPKFGRTPPQKFSHPCFLTGPHHGNRRRYRVESISA